MTTTATQQRQRREEQYGPQARRIAWTYRDPFEQRHRARDRVWLTDDQRRVNDRAFEQAVAAWSANRRVEPELAIAGDEALIFSRGKVRAGVITKVGRLNFEVMYATPTALAQAARHGWGVPITRVSVPKATGTHAIRRAS